jgi:hypothetical protein
MRQEIHKRKYQIGLEDRLEIESRELMKKLENSRLNLFHVIAVAISWSLNKSVLWALFHGFCSWGYVLYYCVSLAE